MVLKKNLLIFLWLLLLISTLHGALQSGQACLVSQDQEAASIAVWFTMTGELCCMHSLAMGICYTWLVCDR